MQKKKKPQPAPPTPSGPFFDDFDGPPDSPPDPRFWNIAKWCSDSNDLQCYTTDTRNVRVDGQSHLVLELHRDIPPVVGRSFNAGWTSGEVDTHGKVEMLFGRLSVAAKLPVGQGLWPAVWTVGEGRVTSGPEFDLIELVNVGTYYYTTFHLRQTIKGTKHFQSSPRGPITDLSTDFHEYWMERHPGQVVIGVDDETHAVFDQSTLPPNTVSWSATEIPLYLILNVAVGGDWTGPPDESTPVPSTMLVDWVRWTPVT